MFELHNYSYAGMSEAQSSPNYASRSLEPVTVAGDSSVSRDASLVPSLRQLVSSLNTMLVTSPATNFEDVLAQLETTDENFHRYLRKTDMVTSSGPV